MEKKTGKTRNKIQTCLSCLGDFDEKEVYWVTTNNGYQILHCMKCIDKKGITDYKPYSKPRKKKTKEGKPDIKKKK